LVGSDWVTGKVDVPIAIVLHGLQGPMKVAGTDYNGAMIAYGAGAPLSDQEVADVLSYVRGSWGNNAAAVSPDDVKRVRAATSSRTTPWTAAELEALK
jgi:mono/diheme cytochrome c family protein